MPQTLYPIDADYIMQKKRSILRELKASGEFATKKIVILSGSTVGELEAILRIFLLDNGIEPEFLIGGYDRFYEDIVFDDGTIRDFAPDLIYFHTTYRNLNFPPFALQEQEAIEYAKSEFERFSGAFNAALAFNCPVICNNFELPPYRPAGNAEARFAGGNVRFVNRMNNLLAELAQNSNLYINDINYLSSYHGLAAWHDETMWYAYKYAFSLRMIPYVAHSLASIIGAIYGKSKKSLILDLDNTLWGGVIGDDGVDGIEIGKESPLGMAHLALCDYALRLKEQGVMLAVCSKNENEVALSGFQRDEMPLNAEDFVSFKANWTSKGENVREILGEMNIMPDAAVFVDDNPAERHMVSGEIEDICVPELTEVDSYVSTIDRYNLFEVAALSDDDKKRTEFVRTNLERSREQSSFVDYGDYLKSLNMTAKMTPVNDGNLERVTQLVNKTNQFNMTTRRYNEGEVSALTDVVNKITLVSTLSDRFGDNGIVSVLFGSIDLVVNECEIDLFIMSCRVFKRDLEFAMIDTLVEELKQRGVVKLRGIYLPTKKNKPCADFYDKVGMTVTEKTDERTVYEMQIADYKPLSKHITIHKI